MKQALPVFYIYIFRMRGARNNHLGDSLRR